MVSRMQTITHKKEWHTFVFAHIHNHEPNTDVAYCVLYNIMLKITSVSLSISELVALKADNLPDVVGAQRLQSLLQNPAASKLIQF